VMGELASELVSLSGPEAVHGVIPTALIKHEQGWDPSNTDPLHSAVDVAKYGHTTVVKDMHTRKQLMAKMVIAGGPGSGFVALSGGYGTMEELMEVTTWNQLGIHNRGVVVFNVAGYYDGLISWINNAVSAGFINDSNGGIVVEATEAKEVVRQLREYKNSPGKLQLQWEQEG
jgi:uncharacterized protein (TIGR00730 family)